MRILGIDTATWRASAGMVQDSRVVCERFLQTTGNHAATLLPLISEALADAGWKMGDLDAIAVSIGPGSFTGLRVGLSVAKGLAWSLGIPLVGVPTLAALAQCLDDRDGDVAAVLDARKGELYAATFRLTGGDCERLSEDALLKPEELVARLPLPCAIIGDATERYGDWLRERLGDQAEVFGFPTHGPRGGVVARLGEAQLQTAAAVPAAELEPFYVRPPDAAVKAT